MAPRWTLLLAWLLGASCSREDERPADPGETTSAPPSHSTRRVVWLAMDGLEGSILGRLVQEGRLPAFREVMKGGSGGDLESLRGFLSPALWTSQTTGVPPASHGIPGFTRRDEDGQLRLVTSDRRRRRALWDILGERGRSVCVVGWLATWPAYPVQGTLVSSYCTYALGRSSEEDTVARPLKGTFDPDVPDLVQPPERLAELQRLAVDPVELGPAELRPFLDAADVVPDTLVDSMIESIGFAHAADLSFSVMARTLFDSEAPALLTVYYGGADVLSHRLWRMSFPSPHQSTAEEKRRFEGAIDAYYEYLDQELARWLRRLDENTTLLVTSDHGFQASTDPLNSGTHRLNGVILWYGNGVRARVRADQPTLLDVLPTLLAVYELPLARDLPGRVMAEVFLDGFLADPPARIDTYERTPFVGADVGSAESSLEPEVLERLEALGYVGDSSVDHARMGDREE